MLYTATEHESHHFLVLPPLFTPYYNQWGQNVYWQNAAFCHDPFCLSASSTSGSPIVIAGNKLFAFTNRCGGTFAFDGKNTLTVTMESGQVLLVNESCDPWEELAAYNRMVLGTNARSEEAFWSDLEYCTWVEQTRTSKAVGRDNYAVFNEGFVYDYLRRVDRLRLPKHGKFTIDDGWAILRNDQGQPLIGDWDIDRVKFPHFERMISDIAAEGFVPGLWFSPFHLSPDSRFGREHPELIDASTFAPNRNYIHYTPENEPLLHDYFRAIFEPYVAMGIRKLKLDIAYGRKNEMIELYRIIREEVKLLEPTVELESHIPDVFAAQYADTIRMNDVSIYPNVNWQNVVAGHFQVCHYSSDRILNLDHLGGNNPQDSEEMFLEHCDMLLAYSRLHKSYPVISMLPDFYSSRICNEYAARIRAFGY